MVAAGTVLAAAALLTFVQHEREHRRTLQRAQGHLDRGTTLYQQKAYPEAEMEFRHALRANPDEWQAPFYVATIEIREKRYGMAIPYLERALAVNPGESKILNGLGVAYFKLGRLDMARGYFMAALQADPDNATAQGLMETMAKLEWTAEKTGVPSTGHAPKH